jgi:hypothetical protein
MSGDPLADPTPSPRWTVRHLPPKARSITELIGSGTLDPELAATLWVLLEGRVPLIVAGPAQGSGRSTLLGALLDLVPPDVRRIELAGVDEDFAWLPQASELGWTRAPAAGAPVGAAAAAPVMPPNGHEGPVRPDSTLIVVPEFSDVLPSFTWGEPARIAVRAATIGYGLGATIAGDGLEDVLAALSAPPNGLTEDELSRIGMVLVVGRVGPRSMPRVVAAHYVRPVARDEHGHVQRLGPAVLATWDARRDRFEHFGWGITPELALRVGRRAGDFELEVARRRELLERLSAGGVVEVEAVRSAIDHDRTHSTSAAISS